MSIAVTCPSGHLLKIADNMAGRGWPLPVLSRDRECAASCGGRSKAEKSSLASRSRLGQWAGELEHRAAALRQIRRPSIKPPRRSRPIRPRPIPFSCRSFGRDACRPTILRCRSAANRGPESRSWPMRAEPDQMAQTLPLPTAELLPRRSAGAAEPAHDIGFDTAGHKAKIIGSWKVLGDVEPPYVPEPARVRRHPQPAASQPHPPPAAQCEPGLARRLRRRSLRRRRFPRCIRQSRRTKVAGIEQRNGRRARKLRGSRKPVAQVRRGRCGRRFIGSPPDWCS